MWKSKRVNKERLPRSYRLLWGASTTANLADGLVRFGVPLLAVQLTRSPFLVACASFTLTLPWLLVTLPAGALADRRDRRGLLLAAVAGRAVLLAVLGLLAITAGLGLWELYAAAILLGAAETVFDTTAQSTLPDLVSGEQLSRANGRLFAGQVITNECAGGPTAGALVSAAAVALLTPAALYGAAAVMVSRLPGASASRVPPSTTVRADVMEGLRFLWRHGLLRALALLTAVMNFVSAAFLAVFVLYAVTPGPLGFSQVGYGLLFAVFALGAVTASLLAERLERRAGGAALLVSGVIGQSLVLTMPLLTRQPALIATAFFTGGMTSILWNIVAVSLRQRISPPELLGRINATYRLLAWGTLPLGAMAGGALAELVGVRGVCWLGGAVLLALLPVALTVLSGGSVSRAGAEPPLEPQDADQVTAKL